MQCVFTFLFLPQNSSLCEHCSDFHRTLRWLRWDCRTKWRYYDGFNATWQLAKQLAEHDGFDWWQL